MRDDSEHIEKIFHIEEMKTELEELSNGKMVMHSEGILPPDLEEQFLDNVLAFERAEQVTHKDLLVRDGIALPPTNEMNDEELAFKLIEVIHTLADHRIYFYHTNHLSDRDLYAQLREDALNDSGPDFPPEIEMNCHIDMSECGDSDHELLWLKYYADEHALQHWAKDFPATVIPPHEEPPYDRDRNLPQPPAPQPPTYSQEEVEAWWTICREKLDRRLAEDGILHGPLGDEPISYCMGMACVCAIEAPNQAGIVGWWGISGDVPTTYLSVDEVADPRAFIREISRRWLTAIEAMERGDPPGAATIGKPKDWPTIIPLLRFNAHTLASWADDDSAWGDNVE